MLPPYVAVFFVLVLLCGLLWLARRKGTAFLPMRFRLGSARHTVRQMQVLERVPLTAQHSLHLVACAGRLMVVAVSPGGCNAVAQFPEGSAEASLEDSAAVSAANGAR